MSECLTAFGNVRQILGVGRIGGDLLGLRVESCNLTRDRSNQVFTLLERFLKALLAPRLYWPLAPPGLAEASRAQARLRFRNSPSSAAAKAI